MHQFQFLCRLFLWVGLSVSTLTISNTKAQPAQHLLEQELLERAQKNIEKHRKGDIIIQIKNEVGNPAENLDVQINQQSHTFHFGAIIFELIRDGKIKAEHEELFKKRFSQLFNYAVFPFYWAGYESLAGHPEWKKTEQVLAWCMKNGITCKGHPLAWTHTAGTPAWIYDLPPADATDMLKSRIIENTKGFKGEIDIWDVVNEPVNTISWHTALEDTAMDNANRYKEVSIQEIADWIEPCYRWAYLGNPEADLILNEFGQIASPETRQRFYDLLKELQKRQTPLNGIGIQAHEPRQDWYDPAEVWKTLELYSEFNLPLHITEFIPQSSGKSIEGGYKTGTWNYETQADYAEMMYTLAFGHPSVISINWWGVSENDIWLEGGGLLEKDLSPKPVYETLDRLINKTWNTNFTATTNKNGQISARGFYGDYEVTVTKADGEKRTYDFSLSPEQSATWEITF